MRRRKLGEKEALPATPEKTGFSYFLGTFAEVLKITEMS
jgi:hypothetical protein